PLDPAVATQRVGYGVEAVADDAVDLPDAREGQGVYQVFCHGPCHDSSPLRCSFPTALGRTEPQRTQRTQRKARRETLRAAWAARRDRSYSFSLCPLCPLWFSSSGRLYTRLRYSGL